MNITDTLITLLAEKNEAYPRNDIGTARLFYDLYSGVIRYVVEAKTWYVYDGKRWLKDEGGFRTMEMCKSFATAYSDYAVNACSDDTEFLKYTGKWASRRSRESVLNDAKSIAPMSLSAFDTNRYLLNLQNGTYNLQTFTLQPHRAEDYITKIARVRYNPRAKCPRWERFIDEIMCGDVDTAAFLQKALGYALTGDTNAHNSFYILYGASHPQRQIDAHRGHWLHLGRLRPNGTAADLSAAVNGRSRAVARYSKAERGAVCMHPRTRKGLGA
jgi:putative DNA primase/helicase